MPATLETPYGFKQNDRERAITIIDNAREKLGEPLYHFEVRPLTEEFAFLARQLGEKGLWEADGASNFAGTFKARGAYNKMYQLAERGITAVTAASAGNHLAGVALAGHLLGIKVTAAVPMQAPESKLDNARTLYPDTSMFTITRVGATVNQSMEWVREQDGIFIHPYDDRDVAAGQGTMARDLKRAFEEMGKHLNGIVVPIGGGGAFAGLAETAHEISPGTTIYGVQVEGSESLSISKEVGKAVIVERPNPHFSGLAVQEAGSLALRAVQQFSNVELLSVTEEEVRALGSEYLDERHQRHLTHIKPYEPSSLVAFAGLTHITKGYDENIAVIGTGRNEPIESMWSRPKLQRSLFYL